MFRRGYWLVPIVAVAVTYFFAPEHLRFWEPKPEPVAVPIVCNTRFMNDNGYVFRVRACRQDGGMMVTAFVGNRVVEKVFFDPIRGPQKLESDTEFWKEYKERQEKKSQLIQRQMYREDI